MLGRVIVNAELSLKRQTLPLLRRGNGASFQKEVETSRLLAKGPNFRLVKRLRDSFAGVTPQSWV
jgi:hypothetical protein